MPCSFIVDEAGAVVGIACSSRRRGGRARTIQEVFMQDPKPNSPEDVGFRSPESAPAGTVPCRSCGAPMIWAKPRKKGQRPNPINPAHSPNGNVRLYHNARTGEVTYEVLSGPELEAAQAEGKLHLSHFVTCPNAKSHKKRR